MSRRYARENQTPKHLKEFRRGIWEERWFCVKCHAVSMHSQGSDEFRNSDDVGHNGERSSGNDMACVLEILSCRTFALQRWHYFARNIAIMLKCSREQYDTYRSCQGCLQHILVQDASVYQKHSMCSLGLRPQYTLYKHSTSHRFLTPGYIPYRAHLKDTDLLQKLLLFID